MRTRQPIPFEAPDGQPVKLIFVLLVPEKATDLHLQILSELAQMFSDKEMRAQLLTALPTPADVRGSSANGRPMPQLSVAQLFDENPEQLKLDVDRRAALAHRATSLDSSEINHASQGLIGHLNLVHPNWIQIFSRTEAAYFASLDRSAPARCAVADLAASGLACIICRRRRVPSRSARRHAPRRTRCPLFGFAAAQPADHLGGAHLPGTRAGRIDTRTACSWTCSAWAC